MLTVLANLCQWFIIDLFGAEHAKALVKVIRQSWYRHYHVAKMTRRLNRWCSRGPNMERFSQLVKETEELAPFVPMAKVTEVWIDGAYRSIQAIPDIGPVATGAAEPLFIRTGRRYLAVDAVQEGTQAYRKVGRKYEPLPLALSVAA